MSACVDSKLEVSLPDIDYIEIPASWWDADADKSLLIGVHKHGEDCWKQFLTCTTLLKCSFRFIYSYISIFFLRFMFCELCLNRLRAVQRHAGRSRPVFPGESGDAGRHSADC